MEIYEKIRYYTSYAFRRELVTNGLIQSLSGTAHCYDNARMESFLPHLAVLP